MTRKEKSGRSASADGVLLRPATDVEQAQAWNRLERLLGQASFTDPGKEPSEQDAMTVAVQTIKDFRQAKRRTRRDG
jgi:hypothetical protein